jgi:hypothetical protein
MRTQLSLGREIMVWGTTFSLFLLVSYFACILYGLVVPSNYEMHWVWGPWLPGFEWLTLQGVLLGGASIIGYGFWTAVIIFPARRLAGSWFGDITAQ